MDAILLQGAVRPLTGYLLCYVPLAVVILGLIAFFIMTDRHASRPYLRYNPFVAAGGGAPATRPPAVGETPAGSLGSKAGPGETAVFLGQHGATASVPKEDVPPPAAPDQAASFAGAPPADVPKDLGRVQGVDLPGVDQRPKAPPAPPKAVAPPSAAEVDPRPSTLPSPPKTVEPRSAAEMPATPAVAITSIEFSPAGRDIDGEYVRIENNTAAPIDLSGWAMGEVGRKHTYTFRSFILAPGGVVQLWTKSGADDAANLYWGSPAAIWNNTGDTAILSDAAGNEVARFSYQGK
jgi:hypothetical protein